MKFFHKLKEVDIDLTDAILGHSADKSIIYKEVDGEPIYLGYYFPKDYDRAEKYATFIFIHGGGWENRKIFDDQSHWQGDYLGYLARYYADKGFLCVSMDYRIIKKHGQMAGYELIDSYEDCCDAMDYILGHADEYGADANNMYLLGESAGGHLAGALITFSHHRMYKFRKAILVNPITDLYDEKWQNRVPIESTNLYLHDLSKKERTKFLSPLYRMNQDTCDVLLIHGESDTCVNPEHSKKFYGKMNVLGNKCELHFIEKTNHAFLLAEYSKERTACSIAIDIINKFVMGVKEDET